MLSPATRARTSEPSLKKSAGSGTPRFQWLDMRNGSLPGASWVTGSLWPGASLMPSTGACPSEGNASTLSQILMDKVPERFYLSPKACRGILRRASEHGRVLPDVLRLALERQAQSA
nr:hypothetical protein [Megasphaera sp. DISK 18]